MGYQSIPRFASCLCILLTLSVSASSLATRKLSSLYIPPPISMTYHQGPLLGGSLPISILWYGGFTPAQKAIVSDFLQSLTSQPTTKQPTVSQWWNMVQIYLRKAGKTLSSAQISYQAVDDKYSLGKLLTRAQIQQLGDGVNAKPGGLTIILTSQDVAVEGFCMRCGFHTTSKVRGSTLVWVGNSATQCPGQCAWPFHQPMYGPQTPPLVAPNGDVGIDGMIINIASLLAGAVTNPNGNGYYQGEAGAGLEAGSACPGIFGKGAYPGYPGELLLDASTGGSYNAVGLNGRKYLLPALVDPSTSQCATISV